MPSLVLPVAIRFTGAGRCWSSDLKPLPLEELQDLPARPRPESCFFGRIINGDGKIISRMAARLPFILNVPTGVLRLKLRPALGIEFQVEPFVWRTLLLGEGV